ncbi:MAG TPA: Yip1 family protein [Burkholderiales bacterium]|nr:Yip1 family protein [Burkholderiales bacterium]
MKRAGASHGAGWALRRALRLTLKPAAEWAAIAHEGPGARRLLFGYVVPLALLPAMAWMIGLALFPHDIVLLEEELARYTADFVLRAGVVTFAASVASVAGLAAALYALAPMYGAPHDWARAWTVAAYGSTPLFLGGILLVKPVLVGFVLLLALFQAGYLYVLGLQALGLVRPQQATECVAVALLLVVVVSGLTGALLAALHIL